MPVYSFRIMCIKPFLLLLFLMMLPQIGIPAPVGNLISEIGSFKPAFLPITIFVKFWVLI